MLCEWRARRNGELVGTREMRQLALGGDDHICPQRSHHHSQINPVGKIGLQQIPDLPPLAFVMNIGAARLLVANGDLSHRML